MTPAIPILIFLIIGGLVIAGMIYAQKQAAARREALFALAGEIGWEFDPSEAPDFDDQYGQYDIFTRGHSRSAYNTLIGALKITCDDRAVDLPARIGDYTYKITRSTGKSTTTTTYRFSYLMIHFPWPNVPPLLIRHEGLLDKIAGALGFDDIDFESEEFSRRFCVKSPEKKFAYDVCDPRMMEFLLQTTPPAIDMQRGCCCVSDGSRQWEPEQFRAMLGWANEFFARWPAHVVRSLE